MDVEFISPEFEQLKSPYYDDFFFQHVDIVNTSNEKVILSSDFQGKFLQLLWDALIEFEYGNSARKLKQYGKMNFYLLQREDKNLQIVQNNNKETIILPYTEFYASYYRATKNYLHAIKRENARIVLETHFQQLAASCSYYERKFALND